MIGMSKALSDREVDNEHDPEYDSKILGLMRKLYPHASEEQLIDGKHNLEKYVETAWRIAERLEREAQGGSFDNDAKNFYDGLTKVESNIAI
jgi:hypothetical protein